jgi:hypothetical protein
MHEPVSVYFAFPLVAARLSGGTNATRQKDSGIEFWIPYDAGILLYPRHV